MLDKIMEKIKKWWGWATLIVTAFSVLIGGFVTVIRSIDAQNEEMNKTIQMAEKSIIWNKEIPKIERASVCDDYLSRGFNSYTKKLCENVILKDETLLEE